ncbi:hypothetical protein QBC45DRAFT_124829 [Copromyces sp. CBS 386.78]|nr:hypothetical protein QBC45DRAFT_124829 [Copromyces sp. CBS 386.78]
MPSTNSRNPLAQILFGSDPVQPPGQHVADFATMLSSPYRYVPIALPRPLPPDSSSDQESNRFL